MTPFELYYVFSVIVMCSFLYYDDNVTAEDFKEDFLPATFAIILMIVFAPILLPITIGENLAN